MKAFKIFPMVVLKMEAFEIFPLVDATPTGKYQSKESPNHFIQYETRLYKYEMVICDYVTVSN